MDEALLSAQSISTRVTTMTCTTWRARRPGIKQRIKNLPNGTAGSSYSFLSSPRSDQTQKVEMAAIGCPHQKDPTNNRRLPCLSESKDMFMFISFGCKNILVITEELSHSLTTNDNHFRPLLRPSQLYCTHPAWASIERKIRTCVATCRCDDAV